MADAEAAQEGTRTWLPGVGYYPMVQVPGAFADAVIVGLASAHDQP